MRRGNSPYPKDVCSRNAWVQALAGTVSLLILLYAVPARSQPAPEPAELVLDPVTVTATRTPRRISTVADSVEVFTKERIESLLPGDFNEVLRDAVGATLVQSGSRGGTTSLRIRGSENNFVSVLIDGFKFSFPDGDAFDFAHLSPEWIRSAEVLRGPQSTLYGSDAAAGVVNLLMDVGRPGERQTFDSQVRHGSNDTWEETLKLKGGTEKAGYLGTFSRVDTNGRFRNDGYYRTVGTAAFDYYLTEEAKLRLLLFVNQNRFDSTSSDGATNTDLRLAAPLTDRELNAFQRNLDQLAGLRLELRPARWLEYVPRVSFYERRTLFEDKADALDVTRAFFSPFDNETTQTRYHVDNQVNLRSSGGQMGLRGLETAVTTLGFEWEEERFFQKTRGTTSDTVNHERLARSLYAQQQFIFAEGLTLTGGVRVDDFDVGKDDVTGKISASYEHPRTLTRIRGAYGTGTKRPSFNDLFFLSTGGFFTLRGNPNLKSEAQESWEAGVDQSFLGRKLKLSATYYENELKDLIAFSFTPFPNGFNFENISKVRLKGAEFSLALIDFHDFTVHANFNTLDTVVVDDRKGLGGGDFRQGEELLRRPNWWSSGSITYHPDRFRVTLRVNQVSQRLDRDFRPLLSGDFTFPRVNNPGYAKVDLAASYDLVKDHKSIFRGASPSPVKRLSVEIKVNNLLDKDYDEVFGFNAPGIEWFAGFRLSF